MFDNRQIVSFSWMSGHLRNLIVLSKKSNAVGSRSPPAHFKTRRTSSPLTQAPKFVFSKDPFLPPGFPCPHLAPSERVITSRRFSSASFLSPLTRGCIKKLNKETRANFRTCLHPGFTASGLLAAMEHSLLRNSFNSKPHGRRHSYDPAVNPKKLKTESTLDYHTTTETDDGVKNSGSTTSDKEHPRPDKSTSARHHRNIREQTICNRPWEISKRGKRLYSSYGDLSRSVYEFSIASYNVLAQNLLTENAYLYRNCDERYLNWEFRKNLLLSELKHRNPDILCLQEVNEKHYDDFFKPQLEALGYCGTYKKRTGQRKDGCATFYKRDKFDCQLTVPVEYLMPEVPLLDRDNVALVSLLYPKHRSVDTAVCVANTHLLFNPRRGDIKLAQLMILFATIDKLVCKESAPPSDLTYYPVVLCGDFNMEPFSNLYNFVCNGSLTCDGTVIRGLSGQETENGRGFNRCLDAGFLDKTAGITDQCQYLDVAKKRIEKNLESRHEADFNLPCSTNTGTVEKKRLTRSEFFSQGSGRISHRLGLRSVYKHVRKLQEGDEDEFEATTYHSNACSTVDYIFYSSAEKRADQKQNEAAVSGGSHLELMARLKLLSSSDMEMVGKLPNELNASDHTILMAQFSFKL